MGRDIGIEQTLYTAGYGAIIKIDKEIGLLVDFLHSLKEEMQPEISLAYRCSLYAIDLLGRIKFLFYSMPPPPAGLISNIVEERIYLLNRHRQNGKI